MKRSCAIIMWLLVVLALTGSLFAEWAEPIYEFDYIYEDCDTPWLIWDAALIPPVNLGNDTLLYLLAEKIDVHSRVRLRVGKIYHDTLYPSEILYYDSMSLNENIEFGENLCYDNHGTFMTPVWFKEEGKFGMIRYEDGDFTFEIVPYPCPIHSVAFEYMDITSSCNPDSQDLIFCMAELGWPPRILVLDLFYEPPFEPITWFWPPGLSISGLMAKRLTADTSVVVANSFVHGMISILSITNTPIEENR